MCSLLLSWKMADVVSLDSWQLQWIPMATHKSRPKKSVILPLEMSQTPAE